MLCHLQVFINTVLCLSGKIVNVVELADIFDVVSLQAFSRILLPSPLRLLNVH